MNQKNIKMFIILGMILTNYVLYTSDESYWNPWNSKDLYKDVIEGQLQLKAEQGKEFSEQALMYTEDISEKNRLQEISRLQVMQQLKLEQDTERLEQNLMRNEEIFMRTVLKDEEKQESEAKILRVAEEEIKIKQQAKIQRQADIQEKERQRVEQLRIKEEARKQRQRDLASIAKMEEEKKRVDEKIATLQEKLIIRKAKEDSDKKSREMVDAKRTILQSHRSLDEQLFKPTIEKLKKLSVSLEKIEDIFTGYKADLDIDVELNSRMLSSNDFYIHEFFPIFFDNCVTIIDANTLEVQHSFFSNLFQSRIQLQLNHIKRLFYQNIFSRDSSEIAEVRSQLSMICKSENELAQAILKSKTSENFAVLSECAKLTIENLKIFRDLLEFIDTNKKA